MCFPPGNPVALPSYPVQVAVAARRLDRLDSLVEELTLGGAAGVLAVRMDVRDETSIKAGVRRASKIVNRNTFVRMYVRAYGGIYLGTFIPMFWLGCAGLVDLRVFMR